MALYLEDKLRAAGWETVMTRRSDERPAGDDASPGEDLQRRCDISNEFGADWFVSIHLNGAGNLAHGFETWYFKNSSLGRALAIAMCREFKKEFPSGVVRGHKPDKVRYKNGLYVIRHTKAVAVLVELDFITNPDSAKELVKKEVQDRYALVLFRALEKVAREG